MKLDDIYSYNLKWQKEIQQSKIYQDLAIAWSRDQSS